jgi:hypothetical protein
MKYIWEKADVICGTVVRPADKSERYMIGWRAGRQTSGDVTLNSLDDGMVFEFGGPDGHQALAEHLTQHNYEIVAKKGEI